MRVAERLRNYIETEIGNDTAMEKLQKERIVTASNRGTYLSGATPLKVRINIIGSDLSAENIRKLLNKHLANTELYLDFDIHPFQDITDLSVLAGMQKNYPAAISISNNLANPADHLPVSSLKEFPDYKKHLTTLNLPDDFEFGSSLPFTYGTSAIGINRKLMKKIGFSPKKMVGGFSWWEEYKKKCAESGIAPAAVHLNPKQLYQISAYYPLFHALCGFSREKLYGRTPCFNTPEGKKALRIIADQTCIWDEQPGGMEFFQERTPLTLGIGTWISTQNNNPEYPWIRISDPEIIPYTNLKKKRCYLINPPSRLEACFRKDLVLSERNGSGKL